LNLSIRGIDANTTYKNTGPLQQVDFPIQIASKKSMFPNKWGHSYVDPDQHVTYKHTTVIPAGIDIINIHLKLDCKDRSVEFVTASGIFRV